MAAIQAQQLPQERLTIAVTAVVVIESVLEQTIAYTRERSAFGRELLSFQHTRFLLAERKTEATLVACGKSGLGSRNGSMSRYPPTSTAGDQASAFTDA